MEQHPVPQNITGFQFKLIGDMTLGQFGYLAGGLISAYLITLLPWSPLFKWPLSFTLGFLGIALAFMPIEERPLDRWFISFFKAVYSPTQFIWKKTPADLSLLFLPILNFKNPSPKEKVKSQVSKLSEYLKTLPVYSSSPLDQKEFSSINSLDFTLGDSLLPQTLAVSHDQITPEPALPSVKIRKLKNPQLKGEIIFPLRQSPIIKDLQPTNIPLDPLPLPQKGLDNLSPKDFSPASSDKPDEVDDSDEVIKLKLQNENLSEKLTNIQEEINSLQKFAVQTTEGKIRLKEMLEKYQEAQKQKENALSELSNFKKSLGDVKKQTVTPITMIPQKTNRVRFIPHNMTKNQGLPQLTQTPNVLTGMIIDSLGNILSGVIVTIKDYQENPVRAIKTNIVGQFKTTTPLANGVYTLELEKEGYDFDIIEVELKGEVLSPIEIKAK